MPLQPTLGLPPSIPDDFRYLFRQALDRDDYLEVGKIVNLPRVDGILAREFLKRASEKHDIFSVEAILRSRKISPAVLLEAIQSTSTKSTNGSRAILNLLLNHADRVLYEIVQRPAGRMLKMKNFCNDVAEGYRRQPGLAPKSAATAVGGTVAGIVSTTIGIPALAIILGTAAVVSSVAVDVSRARTEGRRERLSEVLTRAIMRAAPAGQSGPA